MSSQAFSRIDISGPLRLWTLLTRRRCRECGVTLIGNAPTAWCSDACEEYWLDDCL